MPDDDVTLFLPGQSVPKAERAVLHPARGVDWVVISALAGGDLLIIPRTAPMLLTKTVKRGIGRIGSFPARVNSQNILRLRNIFKQLV